MSTLVLYFSIPRAWMDEHNLRDASDRPYDAGAKRIASAAHEELEEVFPKNTTMSTDVDILVVGGGGEPTWTATHDGTALTAPMRTKVTHAMRAAVNDFKRSKT